MKVILNSFRMNLTFVVVTCIVSSCNSTPSTTASQTDEKKPLFKFNETSYDFGEIQDGDTATHVFKFMNAGNAPLIINEISTSCGCTAVEWSAKPIAPQQHGQIKIQFSKRHDPGLHAKTAIIKANTESPYTVLRISALIKG